MGVRVARRLNGLERTLVRYSVMAVDVDGVQRGQPGAAALLHRSHARSSASGSRSTTPTFSTHDLLFGVPDRPLAAAHVPKRTSHRRSARRRRGDAALASARPIQGQGDHGPRDPPEIPVALSRNQDVPLKVISYPDLVGGFLLFAAVSFGLVAARRPQAARGSPAARDRARAHRSPSAEGGEPMKPRRLVIALVATIAVIGLGSAATAAGAVARSPQPVLAYYYIWFDHSSWRRAKTDYPLLGRYSSDDRSVLRRHVRWAKDAGIEGFIVSWKIDADPRPATGEARPRRAERAFQARDHLPGPRLRARAAPGGARGARSALLRAPVRQRIPSSASSASRW